MRPRRLVKSARFDRADVIKSLMAKRDAERRPLPRRERGSIVRSWHESVTKAAA
jgi:hypothetical protein